MTKRFEGGDQVRLLPHPVKGGVRRHFFKQGCGLPFRGGAEGIVLEMDDGVIHVAFTSGLDTANLDLPEDVYLGHLLSADPHFLAYPIHVWSDSACFVKVSPLELLARCAETE